MKADANPRSMKFLLDTNTVSELMRANPVVLAHLTARPRDEFEIRSRLNATRPAAKCNGNLETLTAARGLDAGRVLR